MRFIGYDAAGSVAHHRVADVRLYAGTNTSSYTSDDASADASTKTSASASTTAGAYASNYCQHQYASILHNTTESRTTWTSNATRSDNPFLHAIAEGPAR